MAQLVSRGTLTRSRWDYFESSNGWAQVGSSTLSGVLGCYLANNSTGNTSLDIYSLHFTSTVATAWWVLVLRPPIIVTPAPVVSSGISPVQVDRAVLPGVVGAFTAISSAFINVANWAVPVTDILLNPLGTMFWVSLPPGWAICAYADAGSNPYQISTTIWYQEVLDNVSPAR